MMNFDRGGGKWQVVRRVYSVTRFNGEFNEKFMVLSKDQFFPSRDIFTENALSK